jgi:hypothetical protein
VSATRYSQSGVIHVSTGIHNWNDTTTGGRNVPASFTGSFGQATHFQLDLTHTGDPVHYRLVAVSSACPTVSGSANPRACRLPSRLDPPTDSADEASTPNRVQATLTIMGSP